MITTLGSECVPHPYNEQPGRDPTLSVPAREVGVASADPPEFVAKVSPEPQASANGFDTQVERMLNCLQLATMASEDLCGEGRHSSGRLSEAS
jgi:hypothetical protein